MTDQKTLEDLIEAQADNFSCSLQDRRFLRDDHGNEPECREVLRLNLEQFADRLAALASPPVSERERELEGALRVIADASRRSETMFGGKMSDVTRVFQNITRVAETSLTAQPA